MKIGKAQKLWKDRKAVSPVIGVILMVAITVILAAGIAMFAFGTGSTLIDRPNMYFIGVHADSSDGLVYMMVAGTDSVLLDEMLANIEVISGGESVFSCDDDIEIVDVGVPDEIVNAGDTIMIDVTCDPNDQIRVLLMHTPTKTILSDITVRATA